MEELIILKKSRGINSSIDPKRQVWTKEGYEYLEAAVNVDITDSGRISTRDGFIEVFAADAHSLFFHLGVVYCVVEDDLVTVHPDYSTTLIRSGIGSSKIVYQAVGDKVFYTNGAITGYLVDIMSFPWESTRQEYGSKVFSAPPPGKHLCLHHGKIFIADDTTLWYTSGLDYMAIVYSDNFFSFTSQIRMVMSVGDALYVADSDKLYAIVGKDVSEVEFKKVINTKVVRYTDVVAVGTTIFGKYISGQVGIFTARNGIYAAGNDGTVTDLTENRLRLPEVDSGIAYIRDGKYTVLINE